METVEQSQKKLNRTLRLDVRVNEEENSIILGKAQAAGLPLSEYVRRVAMGQRVSQALSSEERASLIGIGRNLNQAMKLSHARQQITDELAQLVDQLKAILSR